MWYRYHIPRRHVLTLAPLAYITLVFVGVHVLNPTHRYHPPGAFAPVAMLACWLWLAWPVRWTRFGLAAITAAVWVLPQLARDRLLERLHIDTFDLLSIPFQIGLTAAIPLLYRVVFGGRICLAEDAHLRVKPSLKELFLIVTLVAMAICIFRLLTAQMRDGESVFGYLSGTRYRLDYQFLIEPLIWVAFLLLTLRIVARLQANLAVILSLTLIPLLALATWTAGMFAAEIFGLIVHPYWGQRIESGDMNWSNQLETAWQRAAEEVWPNRDNRVQHLARLLLALTAISALPGVLRGCGIRLMSKPEPVAAKGGSSVVRATICAATVTVVCAGIALAPYASLEFIRNPVSPWAAPDYSVLRVGWPMTVFEERSRAGDLRGYLTVGHEGLSFVGLVVDAICYAALFCAVMLSFSLLWRRLHAGTVR